MTPITTAHYRLGAIKLALNFGPLFLSEFDNFGDVLYVDCVQVMCKTTTSAHDFEGLFEYAKCINICLGFGKMTIQGGPIPTK